MKKLFAMLLCVVLVLSLATVAFAAEVADIRIEAEKPSAKTVDLAFHPFDWDPNSGVDHRTNRTLDADGLHYTNAEKTAINFAVFDSYTYTVDVAAAGTYELHILADCDRDTPIIYTVNGGTAVTGTFLGYTNGEGYSGSFEDEKLGEVELVKGTNTLTFTITDLKNYNLYTDAYVLVPVNVQEETPDASTDLPEILKGTPTVDGKMDEMYKDSYKVVVDKSSVIWVPVEDKDDVKTTVYFLHDGEYIYVCAEITGDSAIVDTNAAGWPVDGIDVWFLSPEANVRTKITLDAFAQPYDEDNKYIGQHENGLNVDLTKIEKAAVRGDNSYVVEAKIPVPYYSGSEGTVAFNIQLNNVYEADTVDSNAGSKLGGYYGKQYQPVDRIVALSDTEAAVPDDDNAKTGDTISVVAALLAVSAMGLAVTVSKKKEF